MDRKGAKWLSSALLAAALFAGTGTRVARAQEPPPGSRADKFEDKREARRLRLQIEEDKRALDATVREFGSHSPQARSARHRLREDRRRLKRLRVDQHRDEEIRERGVN